MPLNTSTSTGGTALVPPNNPSLSSGTTPGFTQIGQQNTPGFNFAPITFGSTLPSIPAPVVPAPKTVTVATPAIASSDLASKQATTGAVAGAVQAQNQANLSRAGATATSQANGTPPAGAQTGTNPPAGGTPAAGTPPAKGTGPAPVPTNSTAQQILQLVNGGGVSLTRDQVSQIAGLDFTGFQQNSDGTFTADPSAISRVDAANGYSGAATGNQSTGDPTSDYVIQALQQNQAQADLDSATHQQQLNQILNGTFPLTADQQSQVASLQSQFDQLKVLQQQSNTNFTNATTILGIRAGREQYAPYIQQNDITDAVNKGISKLADLDVQAASAVATLKQGFLDSDYKIINQSYADLQAAQTQKSDTLTKIQDTVTKAVATQTAKIQQSTAKIANDTAKINSISASALQQSLKLDGTLDFDKIQSIADANGVDPNALYGAIQKEQVAETQAQEDESKFASDQLQAKAQLAQTQATTRKTNIEADAEAPITPNDPNAAAALDPNSQSILAQTGLSVAAFNFLTQGTSALSRLSAADRQKIMGEAQSFLNNKGIDYSTFQSQYKAQNDVLQKNVERAANTKVFAGEVSGTAQQFINDVGNDFGSLKPAAVAKLYLTGQTNDPTTQKYAFDLQTMQNDLAGYYAASRGATSPDQSDLNAAAGVITAGLSGKGAQAFKDSIDSNEAKVSKVVNQSVNDAQKSVWTQFGVGDKYNPSSSTATSGSSTATQLSPEATKEAQSKDFDVQGALDSGYSVDDIENYLNGQ